MPGFIVERAAIDWLTLGSFHAPDWMVMKMWFDDVVTDRMGEKRKAKRLQYKGEQSGQVWLGTATQRYKIHGKMVTGEHALMQVSGASADALWHTLAETVSPRSRCTRVDLQVTVPMPNSWHSAGLVSHLQQARWGRGRPPEVQLIANPGGDDTVYIGARTSDRLIRIYVKERDWLRFEVQYSGDYAKQVWGKLRKGEGKAAILKAEVLRVPLPFALSRAFERFLSADPADLPKTVRKNSDTLAWLYGQVNEVVKRMMLDHDEGEETRQLVRDWCKIADNYDRLS